MKIDGMHWKTIWLEEKDKTIKVIDQTKLPHEFIIRSLKNVNEVADAITSMVVRGAPLIGVTAAYGIMLSMQEDPSDSSLENSIKTLSKTRPTAINLYWSLQRVYKRIRDLNPSKRAIAARDEAQTISEEDISCCNSIGTYGLTLLKDLEKNNSSIDECKTLNILTHCNAGWLATVDWGTALAPIYKANQEGLKLHVWVSETRPRNQGFNLTAFELDGEKIPYTLIVDNAVGYLMKIGLVDCIIVGADRVTSRGDVCNKIGTYLRALAAKDNNIPFYVATPSSSIDLEIEDGFQEIPIENRSESEVTHMYGLIDNQLENEFQNIRLSLPGSKAFNPSFDVTPNHLITAFITEKGIFSADNNSIKTKFRDKFG